MKMFVFSKIDSVFLEVFTATYFYLAKDMSENLLNEKRGYNNIPIRSELVKFFLSVLEVIVAE